MYYRLKMVDIDGIFTYSNIVSIRIKGNASILSVYPNPAKNNLSLMVSVKQKEQVTMRIFDNAGNLVQTKMSGSAGRK